MQNTFINPITNRRVKIGTKLHRKLFETEQFKDIPPYIYKKRILSNEQKTILQNRLVQIRTITRSLMKDDPNLKYRDAQKMAGKIIKGQI